MKDKNIFITESIRQNYLSSLKEILRIPSYFKESKDFTFGTDIQKALEHTVKTAASLGFKTYIDPEGYYAYADIGEGKDLIGFLGHIDVVPPGNMKNWKNPPFEPIEVDGKLYARGAQDDKGPIYAVMFAIKALLEKDVHFQKRLRIIFGADEERFFQCVTKYKEKEEIPKLSFVADASFPLIYAEKGLVQFSISSKEFSDSMEIVGGEAINVVCQKILYKGDRSNDLETELKRLGYNYEKTAGEITVLGVSAHAAASHKGVNAITRLAIALKNIGVKNNLITFLAEQIGEDSSAKMIFGDLKDEESGILTCNVGKIALTKDKAEVFIDIRVPVLASNNQEVKEILEKKGKSYGLDVSLYDQLPRVYLDKKHPFIQCLLSAYQEVTGDTAGLPLSTGGATYARSLKNSVAFGASFPQSEKTAHMENERITLEEMYKAMEIYAQAIEKINQLEVS